MQLMGGSRYCSQPPTISTIRAAKSKFCRIWRTSRNNRSLNCTMASLQHPFQRLQYASRNVNGLFDVLIATAGRHIYSYNATNGQRLDVWPRDIDSTAELASGATATTEDQTPPEKRRKLSADIESRQEKQSSDGKAPAWTVVPLIIISSDGKYVIATTAEDKTLRVFELSEDGKLKELSSR